MCEQKMTKRLRRSIRRAKVAEEITKRKELGEQTHPRQPIPAADQVVVFFLGLGLMWWFATYSATAKVMTTFV